MCAHRFELEYRRAADPAAAPSSWTVLSSDSTATFDVTGLAPGTKYIFRGRAGMWVPAPDGKGSVMQVRPCGVTRPSPAAVTCLCLSLSLLLVCSCSCRWGWLLSRALAICCIYCASALELRGTVATQLPAESGSRCNAWSALNMSMIG